MSHKDPKHRPAQASEPVFAGNFNLRYLCEIVFRRKRVLALIMVLTPILSVLFSLMVKSSYLSTITILLGKNDILNPLVSFDMAVSMTEQNRLGSFRKVIYSRPLIEDAIHKLGIDRNLKSDAEMEKAVDGIRRDTLVLELSGDSFQIGFSAPDPGQAKNMVDTITTLFIDKSLSASKREANSAVEFLQKEVEHYEEVVKRNDRLWQEFRKSNRDLLSSSSEPGELDTLHAKLAEFENQLMESRLFAQLYRDRLAGLKPMVSATPQLVHSSPFQTHYQQLQLDMGNLLATRSETHPEVLKKQREMDYLLMLLKQEKEEKEKSAQTETEMRSPIYLETVAKLDDILIKVHAQEQRIHDLHRQEEELLQRMAQKPSLMQEERRLDDECKLAREIYDKLSMKLEEARVTCAVEIEQQASRFSIVEPARVPLHHYKPKRLLFALGGFLGGILLGLTIIFLLEITDPLLVRPGELVRSTGIPLVGTLPRLYYGERAPGWYIPVAVQTRYARVRGQMQNSSYRWVSRIGHWLPGAGLWADSALRRLFGAKRFIVPDDLSRDFLLTAAQLQRAGSSGSRRELAMHDFIERVRQIGIGLQASFQNADHLVCMVASARRGEGRTLLTSNLGVVMACDLKKPVLLIDACLARPDLSALFRHADAPGLGDVLDGRATVDSVLVETGTPNLWLLPAGRTDEYADVLFNSMPCRQLLEQMRERFALALIEVPDMGGHSDGLLIAPLTDGVLMLSRLYETRTKTIEAAVQKLPRAKMIGIVTNYAEYWIPGWLYRWV